MIHIDSYLVYKIIFFGSCLASSPPWPARRCLRCAFAPQVSQAHRRCAAADALVPHLASVADTRCDTLMTRCGSSYDTGVATRMTQVWCAAWQLSGCMTSELDGTAEIMTSASMTPEAYVRPRPVIVFKNMSTYQRERFYNPTCPRCRRSIPHQCVTPCLSWANTHARRLSKS